MPIWPAGRTSREIAYQVACAVISRPMPSCCLKNTFCSLLVCVCTSYFILFAFLCLACCSSPSPYPRVSSTCSLAFAAECSEEIFFMFFFFSLSLILSPAFFDMLSALFSERGDCRNKSHKDERSVVMQSLGVATCCIRTADKMVRN